MMANLATVLHQAGAELLPVKAKLDKLSERQ